MLFKILKKDFVKRKSVNIILFLFITLATLFLASSTNNILTITSGLEYYLDYAKVPNINIITNLSDEKEIIDQWLIKSKQNNLIEEYGYDELITLTSKSIEIKKDEWEHLDSKGASIFLGKIGPNYNKAFNQQGNNFSLKSGEIAISISLAQKNNLKIGNRIKFKINNQDKEFVIKELMKDAAFGNEMVGMSRFIISEEDYNKNESGTPKLGIYHIMTSNSTQFLKELNRNSFESVVNTVTRENYKLVYSFDMIMAALLILVGICLIFIAMLVLRFTLIFTVEEQYQEIGILKAIGIKNFDIKKLYLIKYLVLVLVGSILGLILSIPVSKIMILSVSKNIIMETSTSFIVNVLCAFFIIIIVLLFCYLCTRRLNKVSVITAIKGGDMGERFVGIKGLSLKKRKYIPVSLYLGINDILCHIRKYTVLIITFAISFVLITIPLNTLNTMSSKEMIKKFLLNPDSSIFVRNIEEDNELSYTNIINFQDGMDRVEKELNEKGYKASLKGTAIYFIRFFEEETEKQNIMTVQFINGTDHYLDYISGKAPELENEIAFSKLIMNEYGFKIGNSIKAIVNGEIKEFIITGVYSDYMQMGRSARLNPKVNCQKEIMFDYWTVSVDIDTNLPQSELIANLEEEFPGYEWLTAQQLVNQNVGGIKDALSSLTLPMTLLLCAIIMLITYLMAKLFIAREKGETAMLKSIGFQYRTICGYQIYRMIIVAFLSMIVAIPLSILSNQFMLKPIFAVMGADVTIQVDIISSYILYPTILLIGILLAVITATKDIKKIHIRDMNVLE